MVKYKIGIQFDKDFLNELKDDYNSGVEIRRSEHHIALHPIQLNNFNDSVKDLLSEGIAKYNKHLEGILLGYQNFELSSNEGYIHDDSFYIHLDLRADFFIFRPEINKEMQGFVNRKSKDHVGLLVYNAFNVSIPKPKTDYNWLGTMVVVGQKVQFKITYINLTTCMPFIRGELLSILSEADNVEEGGVQTTKKSKKYKKVKTDLDCTMQGLGTIDAEVTTKHKKTKRKKEKKQFEDLSLDDLNLLKLFNVPAEDLHEHNKPKKKKSRDKEKEETLVDSEPKIHKKRKHSQSESGSPKKN